MSASIREHAPAKVNLALAVTARRSDGYHLLDTIAVFADIGDTLGVAAADHLSLEVEGPFAAALEGETENLVLRAARLLAEEARRAGHAAVSGARISLTKTLPVAAGLGGGSADAAAALRALNRLWGLDMATARLAEIGAALGADMVMCVHSRALRAGGIGERVTLVDMPALPLVLANPGVPLSTGDVFGALGERQSRPLPDPPKFAQAIEVAQWLQATANDLEAPARRLVPEIGDVLDALGRSPGCLLARMSGSGATCFGLFAERAAADRAAARLSADRARWWVRTTTAR